MIRFVVARCGVFATMVAALGPGRLLAHAPLTAGNAAVRQQQQTILIGRVVDSATQRPISAVQVSVAGTQLGARTDDDGRYRIAGLAPGTHRVRFTSIGYTPIERAIQVDPRRPATLDVAMPSVAAQLASVVVVGYGTQSAATVTGSVSTVQGAQLEAIPVPNLSNTIGGKVAGVMSLNTSGEPGADGATLRVRGARTLNDNSPLVVIDGVPDRAGGLDRLSASDIESVSVLKDASAAIYGARAANGVILITTKRGTSGATSITLNANYGVSQPTRLPKMADAATYMTMLDEADVYRGLTPRYTQAQIDAFRAGGDAWRYPNTDWFDATLKSASAVSRADLSMRGGADRMKYFLSLGGDRQDGYYRNSGTKYDQYSFRTNLDGRATERLSVQLDLTGRLEDRNYSNRSASEIFRAIMRGKPNLPAYWPNGLPGPDIEYGNNPVVISTAATGYNRDQRYYLQGTLGGTLQIPGVDGLSLKGSAAYDQQFQYQKSWRTPWTLYTWDGTTRDDAGDPTLVAGLRGYNQPELQQNDNRNNGVLLNLIADYRKQAGDHMLGALAGVERQTVDYSSLSAFRKYFVSDQLDEIFAGGDAEKQNGGTAGLARRQNYFTRLNYSYAGRYMVELIGRRDGSYIFAPDRRFGFFPGVSAGWRISDEAFVKNNVPFIDDLKLRASWGRTGNDRIDQWQYLASYGYGSGYVFGSTEVKSLYPTRTPNPDVTWETAEQTNVALDGTLFHDRVSFTIEAFGEKRDNILWYRNASVPQSTGLTLPRENIGKVDSHGFDAVLSYRRDVDQDHTFDVTLNAGVAKNRIAFWDEAPGAPDYQRSTGRPMNAGLYYRAIGIFRDSAAVAAYPHWAGARPGDIIFEDYNGDGQINADDRVRVDRSGDPTFTGGLTFSGRMRNVDATVFFQGATGAVQYLATESGDLGNYLAYDADGRWTTTNPDATKPRTFNSGEYWRSQANTYYLRNANYLRLKTVELGYRLPMAATSRLGTRRARVYVSGFNLLTWDRLKLMDPESRASDAQYYPQSRVFNTGISFTF